eukprot:m.7148 g.7148  ORF g.7148 m.7148 type:complete len:532 (+) comp3918_c0_seq2:277-1872(+)
MASTGGEGAGAAVPPASELTRAETTEFLALPAPDNESGPEVTLNVATGEPVSLDHLGPVIVTTAGGLERISNWNTLTDREQQVARRRIAKRNIERLAVLRGEATATIAAKTNPAPTANTPAGAANGVNAEATGGGKGAVAAAEASARAVERGPERSAASAPATVAGVRALSPEVGRLAEMRAETATPPSGSASPNLPPDPRVVAVLGSGKFGTAMAVVMARNGHTVRILTRRPEVATSINSTHRHPVCFSELELDPSITATTDPATALSGVDFVVHAIPVQASTKFLGAVAKHVPPSCPVVSLSKGIDVHTLGMMVDVIRATLGADRNVCCLSGPSFAGELVARQPTGMVLACADMDIARSAAALFHSTTLRIYLSEDVVGVEICGALKNVYAIAAGAAEGMGLGLNSAALLVTRANKEMARVCIAKGAEIKTVTGLSGVGDLMLTCFGKVSRNRTVGRRLGEGETVADILATSTEVAEGVATTPAAARLARALNVRAPIIFAMEQVLAGAVSPNAALMGLMARPMSVEDT